MLGCVGHFFNRPKVFNFKSVESLIFKLKNTNQPSEIDNMALTGILSTQLLFHYFITNFERLKEVDIVRGTVRNK